MKRLNEFSYKYNAQVRPSSQRWRRAIPVPYSSFKEQGISAFIEQDYETIAMVDITMPEDRFRALLEHDSWIENAGLQDNQHFANNVMRVSNLIIQHERECRLRNQHTAVQKAWEQYQIMLKMVDDGI